MNTFKICLKNPLIIYGVLTVNTPVAGEEGGHTGGAGAIGVAVEEGEVGGHEVRAVLHPH